MLRVEAYASGWKRDRGILSTFARTSTIVTNRSGSASGPTLVPDATLPRLIAGGMECAYGSSLVLVENPCLPLEGWAMGLGAIDLRSGKVTPDTRTNAQRAELTAMVPTGYNGWRSAPGRRSAVYHMARLVDLDMPWWTFFSSVLAMDPTHADLDQLKKLAPPKWRADMAEHRDLTRGNRHSPRVSP